jgi:hypothetical protein
MQSLFDAILAAAIDLMHADAGTVQLLDPAINGLGLLAVQGIPKT